MVGSNLGMVLGFEMYRLAKLSMKWSPVAIGLQVPKSKDSAHLLISKVLPPTHVKTLLDVFGVTVYGHRSCK